MVDIDHYRELIERELIDRRPPISVRDLAKEIGVSYQTIYAILHRRYDSIKKTVRLRLDDHYGIKSEPTYDELKTRLEEVEAKATRDPNLLKRIHIDPYERDRLKKTYLAANGNVRFFARLSGADTANPREWFDNLKPGTQENLLKLFWLMDEVIKRDGLRTSGRRNT